MEAATRAPSLDSLNLLDCQCIIGPWYGGGTEWVSASSLIEIMDQHHINEAVVVHASSLVRNALSDIGNEQVLKDVSAHRRLHPCWVLDPDLYGGAAAEEQRIEEMLSRGVRVAMLYPKHVPILPWIYTNLLAALECHHVPCIMNFAAPEGRFQWGELDKEDWRTVWEIATTYPDLPLIIGGMSGTGSWDPAIPLLAQCKNVHIDTMHGFTEWLNVIKRLGPEQFLFASRTPKYDPGMYVSAIQYADGLDADAKRLIGGGNMRRLMEGIR